MLRFAHRGQLVELAQPYLELLSEASGETINLAVPSPLGVEHLAQVESRHFLGTGQWVGRRVPFHCTAIGKVLMAFGGVDLANPPTPARAAHPGHDRRPGPLAGELERVRRDGCATAIDELEVGLLVARRTGRRRAWPPLSISGPTLRLDRAAHGRAPTHSDPRRPRRWAATIGRVHAA